ncbi:MAG: hypothetical protein ACFFG0_37425 [Candidatus Thorarchaeota archaeon]
MVLNELANNNQPRVRACSNCHEYCIVDVNNYNAIQLLHQFEKTHRGHRTQIVNLDEIKPKSPTDIEYTCILDLNKKE